MLASLFAAPSTIAIIFASMAFVLSIVAMTVALFAGKGNTARVDASLREIFRELRTMNHALGRVENLEKEIDRNQDRLIKIERGIKEM